MTDKYKQNLKLMESESILDCQMCMFGSAIAQCIECYRDDCESLMCPDCLVEHLEANEK